MSLPTGTILGPYEILSRLGSGGMGDVYRARDARLGREVAIKVLPETSARDGEALRRFEQEARSASALNHPNIITIYDIGSHPVGQETIWYIAMELVEGESLRQILWRGAMPTKELLDIAVQAAAALAAAHAKAIVHRDLKPENILVSREGRVKILDFGLATAAVLEGSENEDTINCAPNLMTQPGTILGTVGYMSPQQAAGDKVDFRSDQFSFGAIIYEMATGKRAFKECSPVETLAAILRDEPESIGRLNPQIPPPLQWAVKRCLAKKPADRYTSTEDLARDLTIMRDHMGAAVVESPGTSSPRQLPAQRNALVGRERELRAVHNLLLQEGIRLITLTGPGGTGKTRLAVQLAEDAAEQFAAGVWFANLASASDSGLVVSTIAQALEVRASANRALMEDIKERLRRLPPALLLLDNFEQVLAAAPVVTELLGASPALKILVTSQSPLHIYGEQEFQVPPLALPDPSRRDPVELLSECPAVALFVQRARAVKPGFALKEDNAAAVIEICARLDGLPLAIELAAARVKILTPAAILGRLESRLRLLTGGALDLPERQQTLRRAMDWSYELLTGEEQKLFRRLAVFVGGFTLEAAEAVANVGDLELDVFDGVASLVDKSLLQQMGESAGEARFGMLGTMREYGLERLAATGEEAGTRRTHAAYMMIMAEDGAPHMAGGTEQALWLERFFSEHDNIRAALGWLIQTGNADWGLRLARAVSQFWLQHAHPTEGLDWITALLKLPGGSGPMRMWILAVAAALCNLQGDFASGLEFTQRNLAIAREQGDRLAIAANLNSLAVTQSLLGNHNAAKKSCADALSVWEELGDPASAARSLSNLADFSKAEGDYANARSLHEQAFSRFQALGDSSGMGWSLNHQGDVARSQGDLPAARRVYEEGLAIFREKNDGAGVASSLLDLGRLASEEGDHVRAHALFAESLRINHHLGRKQDIACVLEEMACSATRQGNWERALQLAGSATALRQKIGASLAPVEKVKLDADLEPARRGLPEAAVTTAWMRGWAQSPDEAIDYGLTGS
jgi:predicted ATPase/serine/threonine protein kinase